MTRAGKSSKARPCEESLPVSQAALNQKLWRAATHGQSSAEVWDALRDGADPLARDAKGRTALMLAAGDDFGDLSKIELLLPISDPDATDNEGITALMCAIFMLNTDSAALLIDETDCEIKANDGKTALHYATDMGDACGLSEADFQRLIAKSDSLATDAKGVTALMLASISRRTDKLIALLPVSDVNAQDEQGWSALMYAAWSGHINSVGLLSPESDPSKTNRHGDTAARLARKSKHDSIADFIEARLASNERSALSEMLPPEISPAATPSRSRPTSSL